MARSASHALLRNEAPVKGVWRIAESTIQRALLVIAEPTADPDEDVHLIRTTTKHLRALFRMIRPLLPDETFQTENAHLGKAADMLAGSRDAAVALQTLACLGTHAKTKSARIALEEAAVILRHASPRETHGAPAATLRRVGATLEAARPRWATVQSRREQWEGVIEGFIKVYRTCRSRGKTAVRVGDYESFHRWRARVKNLYFQAMFLAPIWPKRFNAMVADLHELQSTLGDLHDLAVLQGLLTKHLQGSEAIAVVLEVIETRRCKLARRACKLGAKLFSRKPRKFARRLEKRVSEWMR